MSRLTMTIGLIAILCGCTERTGRICAPGYGSPAAVFTLFFGKAIPRRGDLTDKEWQIFLDTTVTVDLPNGYTVMNADGGWINPKTHKTVIESTKLLLVALPDVPDSLAAINRVRAAYQLRFHQQLVGMTVVDGCATF